MVLFPESGADERLKELEEEEEEDEENEHEDTEEKDKDEDLEAKMEDDHEEVAVWNGLSCC